MINDIKHMHRRILLISNNCLSKEGANGRTLSNLLFGWPIDCLAQFYIHNEMPDFERSKYYYRVLDVEALKSFFNGKEIVGRVYKLRDEEQIQNRKNSFEKHLYSFVRQFGNSGKFGLIKCIRNIVWNSNKWKGQDFNNWINEFDPELILVQISDCSFILKLAMQISIERNIPLVVYNCEDYYFKKISPYSPFRVYSFIEYRKVVRDLIKTAEHCIYNSEKLRNLYSKCFQHRNSVIMTSTNITNAVIEQSDCSKLPTIVYAGNIGVGRHKPLIEIAQEVYRINRQIRLEIYGSAPNARVTNLLRKQPNIIIKGMVGYEDIIKIMKRSDIILHVESNHKKDYKELINGFSTKIADCLAVGKCLFAYGPKEIASIEYLKKNEVAFVANYKSELASLLSQIITDKSEREKHIRKALTLADRNHNIAKNSILFGNIIKNLNYKRLS